MKLTFTPIGGDLGEYSPLANWLLVAGVTLILAVLLYLAPARKRLSPRRRLVLFALRTIVILLVALAMAQPALVDTVRIKQKARLVLLADCSRSMQVSDGTSQQTRYADMRSALDAAWPALADLARDWTVQLYTFDERPHAIEFSRDVPPEFPAKPEGHQTAIGAVLDDVRRGQARERLAGVVLLSDGAQRSLAPRDLSAQVAADRYGDLGHKLFTVTFGGERGREQARDIAVTDLLVPATVFVKNRLEVEGAIRVGGYVNQDTVTQLLVETEPGKMTPVGQTTSVAREDGQRLVVALDYVPQLPGEYKVTLRSPPQAGELVTVNNEMSTFVSVLPGGLNVLYIEGSPRIEQKFIRRSLDASPDIKVDFIRLDARRPELRPGDLAERFQPGKYNVYILGDLDSSAFQPAELTALAAAVEQGAGFLMLGGYYSFGAGGYGQGPLAAVLPVDIDRFERRTLDDRTRDSLHWPGPLPLTVTSDGQSQSLTRLGGREPAANLAAWAKLPPLDGANKLKPRADAQVLVKSSGNQPLLIARGYGRGRVLAFAGDTTWRWAMRGQEAIHKRFWRQTILWLARLDERTANTVEVLLDQRRYSPGSRVSFVMRARTPEGEPLPNADFHVEVLTPGGTVTPISPRRDGDTTVGSYRDTTADGDYVVRVRAMHGGVEVGATQARFLVFTQDLEMESPVADHGAMADLAARAGGRTVEPDKLAALFAELRRSSEAHELEVREHVSMSRVWETGGGWLYGVLVGFLTLDWPFLLAFVTLLGSEWFLRKKWGLA